MHTTKDLITLSLVLQNSHGYVKNFEIYTVEKFKVKSITIKRAEGLVKFCGIVQEYKTWEDAKFGLLRNNSTYPAEGQGYDKHDFKVIFEDGEEYTGRLDVKQITCNDNDQDVREHVRDFVLFYAGMKKPGWMKQADYDQSLVGTNKQDYIDFLTKHDV